MKRYPSSNVTLHIKTNGLKTIRFRAELIRNGKSNWFRTVHAVFLKIESSV